MANTLSPPLTASKIGALTCVPLALEKGQENQNSKEKTNEATGF